jgi:hypothetical protein
VTESEAYFQAGNVPTFAAESNARLMLTIRTVILTAFTVSLAAPAAAITVGNRNIGLTLNLDGGITIESIRNKATRTEHLAKPSTLFEISAHGTTAASNGGITVDSSERAPDGLSLKIGAYANALPLRFGMEVAVPKSESIGLLRVTVTNTGTDRMLVRGVIPKLSGLVTFGPSAQRMGMVPAEIGNAVPLEYASAPRATLGMTRNPRMGLPTGMNSMEVASIYDAGGTGGIFFSDVDGDLDNGIEPLQFTLSSEGVSAYWSADLAPGQTAQASRVAIGVHRSGDWHTAVDYYVAQHRPRWHFPVVPAWFRDQGAIYSSTGSGSGGIYMQFPRQNLKQRIGSFENLVQLLDEAQSFGTNIVYIADYWEGAAGAPSGREYSNKGDYIPRSDLGGPAAFKEGIRAVHQRGGRVIAFVQPFIILFSSSIGKEKGAEWAGRNEAGELYSHYRNYYSMVPSFVPW